MPGLCTIWPKLSHDVQGYDGGGTISALISWDRQNMVNRLYKDILPQYSKILNPNLRLTDSNQYTLRYLLSAILENFEANENVFLVLRSFRTTHSELATNYCGGAGAVQKLSRSTH